MKRTLFQFHLFVVAAATLAAAVVVGVAVWWVDPYGEFARHGTMKTFASNVLTARKHLDQLRQGRHVLVFGTSRSRFLSSAVVGEPVINLHSIYGNPHAVMDFLDRLDPRQVGHIARVIYLLDGHTMEHERLFTAVDYESPWAAMAYRLKRAKIYMAEAWAKVKLNALSSYGGWIDDWGASHNVVDQVFTGYMPHMAEDRRVVTDDNLALLSRIDAFFRERGIEVAYVRPTFPLAYLRTVDRADLLEPLRRFVAHLPGGVHDLTYVDGLSSRDALFFDSTHLNVAGTRAAFPRGRPLGRAITAAEIDAHLAELDRVLDDLAAPVPVPVPPSPSSSP